LLREGVPVEVRGELQVPGAGVLELDVDGVVVGIAFITPVSSGTVSPLRSTSADWTVSQEVSQTIPSASVRPRSPPSRSARPSSWRTTTSPPSQAMTSISTMSAPSRADRTAAPTVFSG